MDFWLTLSKLPVRSLYFAMPFLSGLCALLLLSKVAPFLGLLDTPTERKNHTGNIPLVGGVGIFCAISLSAVLLVPQFQVAVFVISTLILISLGILDDIFDLPAVFRLAVQFLLAIYMALFAGLTIGNLGSLYGNAPVLLDGVVALLFTVMCTIGVINSVNMLDGVDGLAGSILLISFCALGYLAWQNSDLVAAQLLAIVVGSIAAFLSLNSRLIFSRARIFLGDSGSMLLGLIFVWFLIRLSQGDNPALSPVVAGWIFGLPLVDTISVMVARTLSKKSPLKAGRDHLHHRLLDCGFSVNQTVLIECFIHSVLVGVGFFGNFYPEWEPLLFWGFVLLTIVYFFASKLYFRCDTSTMPRSAPNKSVG